MATTNAMIIELYKAEHNISMPIHTFAKWKSMGYSVKKGEKAQHRITIWKSCTKSKVNADGEEVTTTHMILKESCFFTALQVEPIKASK